MADEFSDVTPDDFADTDELFLDEDDSDYGMRCGDALADALKAPCVQRVRQDVAPGATAEMAELYEKSAELYSKMVDLYVSMSNLRADSTDAYAKSVSALVYLSRQIDETVGTPATAKRQLLH